MVPVPPIAEEPEANDPPTQPQIVEEQPQINIQPTQDKQQLSLKILQLNCGQNGFDRTGTKLAQLKVYLARANDADIVLLQKRWLDEKRKTPSFIGYAAYRKDRQIRKGGGLITLAK